MTAVAQTNLQLFNQLGELGWDDAGLQLVRDAYALATDLFSGHLRPNGKLFVCHLVGTASVVAAMHSRPPMVAAALLHAAYDSGEFGDGSRGITPRKQRVVTEAVGPEVEGLVDAYTRLDWNAATVAQLTDRAPGLGAAERDLVVLRLANEVDDWGDAGMRYWASDRAWREPSGTMAPLAEQAGLPLMAEALRRVGSFDATAPVPPVLVYRPASPGLRPPRSHRPRVAVAVREVIHRPKVVRLRTALRRWVDRVPFARPR